MRRLKTGERIKLEHKKVKKHFWENKKRNSTERKRKWDGRRTWEKPIRGKWEELRDEGLPDGRRLLPRKHREGRTMGIWSGVSHPIIIQPCHLETERWSYSQRIAETDNVLQAASQKTHSDQRVKRETSWRINKLRNMFCTTTSQGGVSFKTFLHVGATLL